MLRATKKRGKDITTSLPKEARRKAMIGMRMSYPPVLWPSVEKWSQLLQRVREGINSPNFSFLLPSDLLMTFTVVSLRLLHSKGIGAHWYRPCRADSGAGGWEVDMERATESLYLTVFTHFIWASRLCSILKRPRFGDFIPTEESRLHILEVKGKGRGLLRSSNANKGDQNWDPDCSKGPGAWLGALGALGEVAEHNQGRLKIFPRGLDPRHRSCLPLWRFLNPRHVKEGV